jgi:hypothetical protein
VTRGLPIFALPGVVLLPGALLPLHIFEPRYRSMVSDALAGDRTIGMSLMKPGWESGGADPDVFPVGGAGEIVESERLPDGRYNVVLSGAFRFRIVAETGVLPYRRARVEEIASIPFRDGRTRARSRRELSALFEEMRPVLELPPLPEEPLSPERLASEVALRLRYDPAELQALLETDNVAARFETLAGRLREWRQRMKFLAPFRAAGMDPGRN